MTVYDGLLYSWDSIAGQYPPIGSPGVTLEQHQHNQTTTDCLLYRGEDGTLLGVLHHYNAGNLWEPPGRCNLYIKPGHERLGIGSALLREAWHHWDLRYEDQLWTQDGDAWLHGLVERGKINPELTDSVNETFDWKPPPPGVGRDHT